jgi:hypothetical protein
MSGLSEGLVCDTDNYLVAGKVGERLAVSKGAARKVDMRDSISRS